LKADSKIIEKQLEKNTIKISDISTNIETSKKLISTQNTQIKKIKIKVEK
jgi:hypothetical protein